MSGKRSSAIRVMMALAALGVVLLGFSAVAHAVTADGDINDVRSFSSPTAPPPLELPDPDGFTDEPILASQAGGLSPSGFNINAIVVAYEPDNDSYYIGYDVSTSASDDPTFNNATGAFDSDGDGQPSVITDGASMTPVIPWDVPPALSGLTEKYTLSVDVGNDAVPDFLVTLIDSSSGPVLSVSGASVAASAGWTSGDWAGDGPDVEFDISDLSTALSSLSECDFYTLSISAFADTDSDSGEEVVALLFELDRPLRICKLDAQQSPVEGWEFSVSVDGGGPTVVVTGADGCATYFAPAGSSVQICETLAQDSLNAISEVLVDGSPVAPDNPSEGVYCVTVDADDCSEITFQNECSAEIVVKKYNLGDCEDELGTATPVEGFVFHISGGGLDEDLDPTDASGETSIIVAADATYTICETLPQQGKNVFCSATVDGEPATATTDTDTWCVDVAVGCDVFGESHEVIFYDACVADITVKKMNLASCEDEPETGTPVEGFVFHITGPGVDMDLDPTDAAGEVTYTAMELGTYTICETLPQGDKSVFCSVTVDDEPVTATTDTDTWCVDVVVGCDAMGESHEVVYYNTEPPDCEIEVCKKDENGEPVEGWTFQLWSGGVQVGTDVVTGVEGCYTWTELEPLLYVVAEPLPQTVGGKTYTKVDGDVTIMDNCAEPPGETQVPATEVLPGTWGVEVDLSGGCCETSPDVSVTFQNTCEVAVTICKIGIQAAECDTLADTSPVAGWDFTLKEMPDGPEAPYTTGSGGCTDPIVLEPGDYRVCESFDPMFLFCTLEVNGVPVSPSYTEDTNMDGIDDVICYDFSVTCEDVDPVEITFSNAAGCMTRTPGYWFTHPDALKAAFACITGSETGTIVLCASDSCEVTADDAMAIFWTSKGGNRPTLAKHILAAMFNNCLLSPAPGTVIDDALAVLCDPEATSMEIGFVLEPLTDYNESCTDQDTEGFDYGSADPYEAKSMAAMGTVPGCAAGKRIRDRGPRTRGR